MRNVARALAVSLGASWMGIAAASAAITYTDLYTAVPPAGFSDGAPVAAGPGGKLVGRGSGTATSNEDHALFWNGSSAAIDLNPTGFTTSYALGVDADYQVGYGYSAGNGSETHALLWNGNSIAIDLHPSGLYASAAYAVGGGYQVGSAAATLNGNHHAMLWHGTNAAVDLHPSGYETSVAYGVGGGYQVGYGGVAGSGVHALLWHGTNAAIDLNPTGFDSSYAYAVDGGYQVGSGYGTPTDFNPHALLWNGTNAPVDLNPSGFERSEAFGVGGAYQVGYGARGGRNHALLWSGSAGSFVDLHSVLPATFTHSYAYTISGDTVYGYATDTGDHYHALAWTVPEPTSLSLVPAGGLALLARRGPRTRRSQGRPTRLRSRFGFWPFFGARKRSGRCQRRQQHGRLHLRWDRDWRYFGTSVLNRDRDANDTVNDEVEFT